MMCVCECKKKLEFHFFKMVVGVYIGGPHDRPSFLVKIRAGNPISLSDPYPDPLRMVPIQRCRGFSIYLWMICQI